MDAAILALGDKGGLSMLPYGNGRSYGDLPLNPQAGLLDCRGLDRFIAFDPATGVLTCQAGVLLAVILALVCRAEPGGGGWFLPVVPGSRFVTVGGAIANDVHGKNHHTHGTFGRHVLSFEVARSDGTRLTCSRTQNSGMFAAAIGGLGLTGLILQATLQLRRVSGFAVEAEEMRFGGLAEFFALSAESDRNWEYGAAWVDCLASGARLGRGIFFRARHAPGRGGPPPPQRPRVTFPVLPPFSLATPLTVRAFNMLYWRKLGLWATHTSKVGPYEPVLFPLDAIGRWNRIYGPRGFYQFQCVIPAEASFAMVSGMLKAIGASGEGSMLSALKVFGSHASPGLLSFPMPGTTFALDFPNHGSSTLKLLDRLEQMTAEAGGRLYPAKDGVMSARTFRAGYPNIDRFLPYIDRNLSSAFARRVGLVPGVPGGMPMPPIASVRPVIAIFGASSGIAAGVARHYAEIGWRMVLVGRNAADLAAAAADLQVRGAAEVATQPADFSGIDALPAVAAAAWECFGAIDVALIAYGATPDQAAAEASAGVAEAVIQVNFTSPVILINELARKFQARGTGTIAAISSVAGDRGRKSNHLYGAAKGGLHRYLEGVRHRLSGGGVTVLDIRPGFVATKMTAHLDRRGPLWAKPDRVAADIVRAIERRQAVLYTPWFWRWIMLAIRVTPRAVFYRTSF